MISDLGNYFIILGTQSLKGTGLFLFSLFMDYYEIAWSLLCILCNAICVCALNLGLFRMGIFCVFDLGFWGFRFALAVLVCLWALWCWVCVCLANFLPCLSVTSPISWTCFHNMLCLIKNCPIYICTNSKLKAWESPWSHEVYSSARETMRNSPRWYNLMLIQI